MTQYPPPEPLDPRPDPASPLSPPPGPMSPVGMPAWPSPTGSGPGPKQTGRIYGIIAIRPMGLGEILDGAVRAMRHNPRVMFGLSVAVGLISATSNSFFQLLGLNNLMESLAITESVQFETEDILQTLGQFVGLAMIPVALTGLAAIILTGLLTLSVADSVIGAKPSVAQLFARITGRGCLRLLALSLVQGLIMLLILALCVAPVVALAFWEPVVAAIVGVFAFLILILASVFV
ncbi:MAG: hypothetical protein ACRC0L_05285, partial [Angustibacter sp.]